jgi:gamma-glutamylcyclotransferase (GGCT)/AIG2-like uncharacterized protein YtfP
LVVVLYAAYGGNMDPQRMLQRAPHSPQAGTGWVQGWRLTFGGEQLGWNGGALATIVEAPDEQVFVALYDLTPADEKALDIWEGGELGWHRKIRVRVQTLDGEVAAWVYVLDDYEGGLPSAWYLGVLAEAAEVAGAPQDYVDALRQRACHCTSDDPPPSF